MSDDVVLSEAIRAVAAVDLTEDQAVVGWVHRDPETGDLKYSIQVTDTGSAE